MSESARSVEVDESAGGGGSRPDAPSVERIGKYEIVGLLGKGGMGAVYRAFDPFLERAVALKVMLPQIAENPEHKQRFEREARAVARLTHPNVVTVFDLGYHTDGAPYIVMELLQGDDLLHIGSRGSPMPLAEKVSIVLQVLDGLGQAHKMGIVHRDVKPANVFITHEGAVKIMDFGIARLGSSAATGTGAVLGSAAYMSPEQVNGEAVDGRSDLFSVGSMLCELLAGRRPFEADTPLATMYRIAHKEPALELPAGPDYDRFIPVLKKALARDPNDRYATSAEFAEALSQCLDDAAPKVRPRTTTGERGESPGAPTPGKIKTTRPLPSTAAPETPPSAQRPDPSGLFRILRDVYVGGKSGHLHVTSGRGSRSLRVLKGRITHAISDRAGEHLGDALVRYGVISQADLERALETEKRLGPVLSRMGLLDRKGLEEALGLHVREIVFAMLEESEGTHVFEELPDSASEAEVTSSLSTGQVILEATRRVLDPEMVRQVLGDLDRVLVLSSDPLLRSQPITLTPTDGFVLSRVDGTLSARDVISLSPVPPEDTERSLFGLICTGIIDYKTKTPTSRTRPRPAPSAARPEDRPARPGPSTDPEPYPSVTPPPPAEPAAAKPLEPATVTPPEPSEPGEAEAVTPREPTGPPAPEPPPSPQPVAAKPPEPATVTPPEPSAAAEPAMPASSPAAEPATPASNLGSPSTSDPRPREGVAIQAPDADPESTIREAEGLFAEERYEDAIRMVEPLVSRVDGPLRARASILLARSCMKRNSRDKQAESVLLSLVGADPTCTPAYFFLGALYRSWSEIDRARSMYEKVLELSPRHRGAAAELSALGDGPPR